MRSLRLSLAAVTGKQFSTKISLLFVKHACRGECEAAELHCSTRLCVLEYLWICELLWVAKGRGKGVKGFSLQQSLNDVYLMHFRCKKLFAVCRSLLGELRATSPSCPGTWPGTLMPCAEYELIRVALIMPNMLPFQFPFWPKAAATCMR